MSRRNAFARPSASFRAIVPGLALLIVTLAGARLATATHPGIDGLVAYSDVIDVGSDTERTAIFLVRQGQLTQPVARPRGPVGQFQSDNDSSPAWSPDGKLLAFVRRAGGGPSEIYVIRPDKTGLRRVFSTSLFSGSNAHLQSTPIASIRWLADGDTIRFNMPNVVQSFVVGGARTGTDLGAGISRVVAANFDEGSSGTVTGCPLDVSSICELTDGGGANKYEVRFENQALVVAGGFGWSPKVNRRKVVFKAQVSGQAGSAALFSASWDPTNRALAPRVERLKSLLPETITCVDPRTQAVTTGPRFLYRDLAASPSGRYLALVRTEFAPQTDAQTCSFVETAGLILLLRESGFQQGELTSGSRLRDVAWQPDPANLAVRISDGHGHALDGLKLELRVYGGSPQIVDGSMRRGLDGLYSFEVTSGVYVLRAYLEDAAGQEGGLGKAFEIAHAETGDEVAWMDFGIVVPPDVPLVEKEVEFTLGEPLRLDSVFGAESSTQEDLDAMAALYYQSRRFIEWARANLISEPIPTVLIRTFTVGTVGEPVDSLLADYTTNPRPTIRLGLANSLVAARDFESGEEPENIEWHELSHHLYDSFVLPRSCGSDRNHGGFANPTSCDSMREGFAEFLAAQLNGDTSYAGIYDLEYNEKTWGLFPAANGFRSTEEDAVAGLFWDLVDGSFDGVVTQALDLREAPILATYGDRTSIPLRTLWDILVRNKPVYMSSFADDLEGELSIPRAEVDIDADERFDAYEFEIPFLMHGFHPIATSQLSVANRPPFFFALFDGRASGGGTFSRIGQTSRRGFDFHGVRGDAVDPRLNLPTHPNAQIAVAAVDASGTPLDRASVEWAIEYPDGSRTTRHRESSGTPPQPIPFGLPIHFQGQGYTASEVPPCNPATDYVVNVTVHASVNGYSSPDAPTFDNCTYLQAVVDANAPPALTLTLRFPEDSTAPVTTLTAHSLAQKRLYGPALGDYAISDDSTFLGRTPTPASWTIELECDDPVIGGFAAGCSRIEYSLDAGAFETYSPEREIEIAAPGLHTLAIRSVDGAGNVESSQTFRYGIVSQENRAPYTVATVVPSVPPFGNLTTGFWTITLACFDDAGGVQGSGCLRTEYAFAGEQYREYTAPIVLSDVGTYTILYRATDVLGNVQQAGRLDLRVATVIPDIEAPRTQVYIEPFGQLSIVDASIMMGGGFLVKLESCLDPGQQPSGCARSEYRLNGGAYQPFTDEIVVEGPGVYDFEYRSIDVAGNEEPPQSRRFTILAESDRDSDGLLDFVDNCQLAANVDQLDTDGDCFGNRCDADFNQNGTVDSNDASVLKTYLGRPAAVAPNLDLDGDGTIGASDAAILRAAFRQSPGPALGHSYDQVVNWCN